MRKVEVWCWVQKSEFGSTSLSSCEITYCVADGLSLSDFREHMKTVLGVTMELELYRKRKEIWEWQGWYEVIDLKVNEQVLYLKTKWATPDEFNKAGQV